MLHRLSVGLLATAIFMVPLPAKAQYGSAEDLGEVMNISLKDVVNTTFADQCALQVANAGSGAFGWLADANKVLSISDSLSYDESLDTRFASDVTWRFGVNGLDDGNVDNFLFIIRIHQTLANMMSSCASSIHVSSGCSNQSSCHRFRFLH